MKDSEKSHTGNGDGPYSIGVTGHRHLPQERLQNLSAEIKAFYQNEIAQHGTENIAVLSSLAEGADTLCAKLALDEGLRLTVPLPMNALEYRKDFSISAAAEFDCLLSLADHVFVVQPEEPLPPGPQRGFLYRQAGICLARHCDVLLAVWDGMEMDTRDGAGTWETIKLAQILGKPIRRVPI